MDDHATVLLILLEFRWETSQKPPAFFGGHCSHELTPPVSMKRFTVMIPLAKKDMQTCWLIPKATEAGVFASNL